MNLRQFSPHALLVLIPLLFAGSGCPAQRVCTGCIYKTAQFTVPPSATNGAPITSANMHSEVTHEKCPVKSSSASCTETLDIDVGCVVTGPGEHQAPILINADPNASSHSASLKLTVKGSSAPVTVVGKILPGDGVTSQPPAPCGGKVPAPTLKTP